MSDEDDPLASLHLTDPWIAAITGSRIEQALSNFAVPFAAGWDLERLTRAVQDKANLSRESHSLGPERQSNTDARNELKVLANLAKKLLEGLEALPETASQAAYWEAFHYFESHDETPFDSPAHGFFNFSTDDFRRLLAAPLTNLAEILEQAAYRAGKETQAPRWREREAQWLRVRFAMGLTPIFEEAFGLRVNASNWPASYGREHPWPEFYRRIYKALYPEVERINLTEVLQRSAQMLPAAQLFRASFYRAATRAENSRE